MFVQQPLLVVSVLPAAVWPESVGAHAFTGTANERAPASGTRSAAGEGECHEQSPTVSGERLVMSDATATRSPTNRNASCVATPFERGEGGDRDRVVERPGCLERAPLDLQPLPVAAASCSSHDARQNVDPLCRIRRSRPEPSVARPSAHGEPALLRQAPVGRLRRRLARLELLLGSSVVSRPAPGRRWRTRTISSPSSTIRAHEPGWRTSATSSTKLFSAWWLSYPRRLRAKTCCAISRRLSKSLARGQSG